MGMAKPLIGTLLWYGDHPYEGAIRKIHAIGFDYFEFSLDYPLPNACDAKKLKKLIEELGIGIAFHAPLDILLAQPRDEIFEASLKVFRKCLNFASIFETLYFNFHLGWSVSTHSFLEVKEKIKENGIKSCKEAVEFGSRNGFEVSVEYDQSFDESFLVKGLNITFDVGHFIVDEVKKGKNYLDSLKIFLRKHKDRILVIHLHDCNLEDLVDHVSFGKGSLDLKQVVRMVGGKRYILIETFWSDSYGKDVISYADLEKNLEYLIDILNHNP
jgi:sugar phosphate isomerase/epimerase